MQAFKAVPGGHQSVILRAVRTPSSERFEAPHPVAATWPFAGQPKGLRRSRRSPDVLLAGQQYRSSARQIVDTSASTLRRSRLVAESSSRVPILPSTSQ